MDTVRNHSLHFGAKFIKNINIKKYNPKSHLYTDAKATLVKFEPKNQADMVAIISTAKEWRTEPFAGFIAQHASYIANDIISNHTNQIYLLTTQQNNLDKIKSGKIIGMAYMNQEDKKNELKFFQVNPKLKYGVSKREYKYIGTEMLNSLKELYKNSIELESLYTTTEFYEKQGFKPLGYLRYRWEV